MSQDIHRSFADVDRVAETGSLIAFLDVVNSLPEVQSYKRRLRELLALSRGQTVLDVGCGTGFEACHLARDYPDVTVIGLDREAMLSPAARRAADMGVSVRWLPGQAEAIPLPEATVDACLTERVLKYVPDPAAGVAEMARVLKPGGRIAYFELDYAATLLGGELAMATAVGDLLNASVSDDRMGRRLPCLLHEAGFRDLTFEVVGVLPPWTVHEATIGAPVREAIGQTPLPAVAATAWLEQQAAAATNGLFTVAFIGVLAVGRLPEDWQA
jgi:SAM-dependent methyltransferase